MVHIQLATMHWVALAFALVSFALTFCALTGTVYALAFAIAGIFARGSKVPSDEVNLSNASSGSTTSFLVIIPAHNEGPGLVPTVESVLAQNYPRLRCVVVADNCTDNTAEIARNAGAHNVLVRTDTENRGKGHALTWAFNEAHGWDWDAVCVIDADSVLDAGFFQVMDQSFRRGQMAVQARYDFVPALDNRNWLQQFGAVSKAGENSFIYRPRERFGLFQLMTGNGFYLSRAALDRVPWRAHSIVEDAEYALALARHGIAAHYQENARLWSRQASTARDIHPQRVRWASGTWELFKRAIPALLASAWRARNWRALEEAAMLLTTSRIILIYLLILSFLFSLAAPALFVWTWSALLLVVLLQFLYLTLMFRFACDRPIPISGLLLLPVYVSVIVSSQLLALVGSNRNLWWRTSR
jgi:cellulose synthase/poly-beta-1,6-N-acetylglucosamine synthase-like glycosyltransferase